MERPARHRYRSGRVGKKNKITKPVIGTLAFLSDAQGVKRTSFAIDTIKKRSRTRRWPARSSR